MQLPVFPLPSDFAIFQKEHLSQSRLAFLAPSNFVDCYNQVLSSLLCLS